MDSKLLLRTGYGYQGRRIWLSACLKARQADAYQRFCPDLRGGRRFVTGKLRLKLFESERLPLTLRFFSLRLGSTDTGELLPIGTRHRTLQKRSNRARV